MLAVEIAMLLLSFTLSGFTSRLNSNAEQILDKKQVVNRAAYISGQMIEAQDLSGLDSAVNRAAAQLVQEGRNRGFAHLVERGKRAACSTRSATRWCACCAKRT